MGYAERQEDELYDDDLASFVSGEPNINEKSYQKFHHAAFGKIRHKNDKNPADGYSLDLGNSFSASGCLPAPDGFERSKGGYLWTPGGSGGNGGSSGSGSGRIITPSGNGRYYQTGQTAQQQPGNGGFLSALFSGLWQETTRGLKEQLYRTLTTWPLGARDIIFTKINSLGRLADFTTSVIQLGWHNGPIQATINDFFYDRLELIYIKETNEIVGIRSVSTRPESGIVRKLRTPDEYGRYVQNGGRPVESLDDLILSREGLVTGYNRERCGGLPLTESGLNYDEFFTKNNALRDLSHGESETKGLSTKELEGWLKEFMLYMTVIRGYGGQRKDIGSREFPDIGKKYTYERILLDDWKTINPNYIAGLLTRGIGAYLFAHPVYSLFEKFAEGLRFEDLKRDIQQRELYSMFIPPQIVVKRLGYG